MTFEELNLEEPLLRALKEEGYKAPTPIQEQSIPHSLKGRDLLACAQTGTGKTAAFALPILQRLHNERLNRSQVRPIRALILTPTRELAIQIEESFKAYGRHIHLRKLVIFGGVGQAPQVEALKKGVDILVATPGRLLDLMNQGFISLKDIEVFVLDEADRMLDMGFIHDVRRVIVHLPQQRQTLFFSATMPPEIAKLAEDILTDPLSVAVTPVSSTVDAIVQSVYFVGKKQKRSLLLHLLNTADIANALVFTRTKHGANRVAQDLTKAGVQAMAIHGNKSQTARQLALQQFKSGELRVLVATDIAARGIDIDELSHVVNFDLPNIPETYVHRIGRTGRAGASGIAISFCDEEEKVYLKDIQKLIGKKIPIVESHPFPLGMAVEQAEQPAATRPTKSARPEREAKSENRKQPASRQKSSRQDKAPQNRRQSQGSNGTANNEQAQAPAEKQDANNRRSSSRNKNRNANRQGAQQIPGRPAEPQQPQQPKQPAKTARKEQAAPQPIAEKTEQQDGQRSWSSNIFTETPPGKKGFTIKSDRYDNQPKQKPRRPEGRKGRR